MTSHDNSNNGNQDTKKNTVFLADPIQTDGEEDSSWQDKAVANLEQGNLSGEIPAVNKLAEQEDWEERAIHAYFRQKQNSAE